MNTTGMMFIASPFMVWADYTWGKTPTLLVARPTQRVIPLPLRQIAINGYTVLTLISALLSKVAAIKTTQSAWFLFNKLKRLIPVFSNLFQNTKAVTKAKIVSAKI